MAESEVARTALDPIGRGRHHAVIPDVAEAVNAHLAGLAGLPSSMDEAAIAWVRKQMEAFAKERDQLFGQPALA